MVILSFSPTWKSSATTCRTRGLSRVRLRPRQARCARALCFGQAARFVPVLVYSVFTGDDCGAHVYTESVLNLTKSSIEFSERLLRGAERFRLLCGRGRCRLLRGAERFRLLRGRERSSSADWFYSSLLPADGEPRVAT